jgi:hypothetical protein
MTRKHKLLVYWTACFLVRFLLNNLFAWNKKLSCSFAMHKNFSFCSIFCPLLCLILRKVLK